MPVHYHLDEKRGVVVGRGSGNFSIMEVIDAFNGIVEGTGGAAFYKPHLFGSDENASAHAIDFQGLMRLRENIARWAKIYPGRDVKTAFVVTDSIRHPFPEMWHAITEANPEIGAKVAVFTTEDEAVAWLTS